MAEKPSEMSLINITTTMDNADGNSPMLAKMSAELARRQTIAQINAAKYMLWSVIAIAITSGLNALFAFLIWYAPRSH